MVKKKQPASDPLPGSPEKVELIHQRASRGQDLFQAGDVLSDPSRRLNTHRLRNGRDRIDQEQPVVGVESKDVGEVAIHARMRKSPCRLVSLVAQAHLKIGERVRSLRQERRLSQGQVAIGTGMSQCQLSKIEMGIQREPSASTLFVLAKFFKVSVDWLLGLTDQRATPK